MPSPLPILQRRRERRQREFASAQRQLTRAGLGCGLTFSLLFSLLLLALGLGYTNLTSDLPSAEALPSLIESLRQPSRLLDRSGAHLLQALGAPRAQVHLNQISPSLLKLTLAVYEPRFYSQPGFSLQGLTDPQAHPTLAQHLAADLLLWDEPPSARRALRERLLAAQLIQRYGHDQVLEWFLNSADYGYYSAGIESAAQTYFGKPAADLNLAEAALLAVTAQSPSLNPFDAPTTAIQRAHNLLASLPTEIASPQEAAAAQAYDFQFSTPPAPNVTAPAFSALALDELEHDPGHARLTRGGALITTTLDYDLYLRAACATQTQLARLSATPAPPACQSLTNLPDLPPGLPIQNARASAVLLDPQNGQILAIVGESDAAGETARLNGHRPGSSLLPFLYLTGFSRGLSPASLVWDISSTSAASPTETYRGPLRARNALVNDILPPAARLLNEMSLPAFEQTLLSFGIEFNDLSSLKAPLDNPNNLSPLTLARAYGALAANGMLVTPQPASLLRIQSVDGHLLRDWNSPSTAAVVSPQLAYLLNNVLADDAARWPSQGSPNPLELPYPSAAKLGTTLDGRETWAVVYTPLRVALVWMETPAPRPASSLAATLLTAASQNLPASDWKTPEGIVTRSVCDPSGMLPTPACPALVEEVFLSGYEPAHADTLFRQVAINRESGLLATVFTPLNLVENRIFMVVPPEAQDWARQSGLESIPTTYDTLSAPPPRPGLEISAPAMLAVLTDKVIVRGSAGGEGFQSYRLQYGQGLNPTHWVLVNASETPVEKGTLGEWDTNSLHGLYILQLVVIRADGQIATTAIAVTTP